MIVSDQSPATFAKASVLSIGLFLASAGAAFAEDSATAPVTTAAAADAGIESAAAPASGAPVTVTVVQDGAETSFTTTARTIGDLLDQRGIRLTAGDYVSADESAPVADGARIVIRSAQPVQLRVGASTRAIRSAAPNVATLLRDEHVTVRRGDRVSPPPASHLLPNEIVQVVHVTSWTARERVRIAPNVVRRTDATLASGKTETVARGAAGVRETTVRYTRVDDGAPTREVLASRIVREPQPRIVVRGIATYQSLARVATQGFVSALHMAGSALHMIATAYTAGCYGCSGVTASGVRAGFGIIAVDPSVIPLGTKVFIPGYGRAVAGDTGGAIQGHRVDLGFDSQSAAMRFGRRPVTLYVLR